MKILHTVEFYEPSKGGAQEVVKQLSEHMVLAGHDVTVATTKLADRKQKTINGVKIVEFVNRGDFIGGYHGDKKAYQKFLTEAKFDVVMNYAAQQWATDYFFDVMGEVSGGKVFVPCGFSQLDNPSKKAYFERMPEILKKYDATVYLAEHYRDIDFARKHGVKNIHIIPNGADEREFDQLPDIDIRKELGIPTDSFLMLHVGGHTGTGGKGIKGHKEAMQILRKTNINNSALLIIGDSNFDGGCKKACFRTARLFSLDPKMRRQSKKIILAELPRQNTLAAFRQADLFLFPSNIEASPLVLFEACASKTPFLATDVGNSAEIARWTGGGEILPTTKDNQGYSHAKILESANMLEDLYNDKTKRDNLAQTGFKSWQKKYSWDKISDSYLKLYKEVMKK